MLTRNLEKAKAAYLKKDPEASKAAHLHRPEQHMQDQGRYIKSIIYGGLDGIITTFAVVAGVAGASLSAGVALVLGLANLFADGLSMAIGDFLSTRAENEYNASERARELWEVQNFPEGEKLEMVELYHKKGIPHKDAQAMVDIIAKFEKAWVDIMMVEELGIVESDESPLKNALATLLSFVVFGAVPLAVFILYPVFPSLKNNLFLIASVMTGGTLFLLGALKVRITGHKWFKSGLEMLLVGGLAAAAAYVIGNLLSGVAHL